MTDELLRFAETIDPERAKHLTRELGPQRSAAVLLGTAFPPQTPVLGWQIDALARVQREGWLSQRQRSDILSSLLAAAGDLADAERAQAELRRAVWAERARIALRELLSPKLGGAGVEVTAGELSELADAALEVALEEAVGHVATRFGDPLRSDGLRSELVVLGMGKLGGVELNAGSDVDLVFVYDTDDGASKTSLHDHWTRVVRRLVATVDTHTADGLIWRVDLRLRPEGSQGPIVNSLSAAERYYETWGRLWERAALLRSRAVAGSFSLGAELARQVVLPFVYRGEVDPNIATALAELVERSRAELSQAPERDLKLGPGGIREAEFFVQSLQLIWGGREPSLRVTGSLPALARLRSRGLVTDREARAITDAYLLLRRVEHHVQWSSGIQTHLLPASADELEKLARGLGYADAGELTRELSRARSVVRELFAALAPSAPRPAPRHQSLLASIEAQDARALAEAEQQLGSAELGEHLLALARRPDALLGALTRERHPELADTVLDAIAASPDPEQSARYLRAFFGRFWAPTPYVSALAGDPPVLHRLVTVLGASAFVGDAVVSRPDLADVILFGGGLAPEPRTVVATELAEIARGAAPDPDPQNARDRLVHGLRRAKRRVMVEVAVADLAGTIGTRDATRILSDLADEVLDRSTRFELGGDPRGLAMIAVGKLGGREIGYASDLDVLFVYDPVAAPPDVDPTEYFVRRAQRVIRLISEPHPAGPGYELDTRLRPSGSHGMLVASIESFARYHGVSSEPSRAPEGPSVLSSGAAWERQALIRARPVAGDRALGGAVLAIAERAAYERGAPPAAELHRLRTRMENELARERQGVFDLKTGRGGLLDIEFSAQWLQMQHGKDPRVRTPDTGQALEQLSAAGHLARPDYEALREGYTFLRRLEQRIHVLRGIGSTVIDVRRPGLAQLARRMGIHEQARDKAVEVLLGRYHDVTEAVRSTYLRVLGIEARG
jgi:[glutamine synthetase] adenylyltransferase / [glutamine synthetase]-adenylyl-L-tyrosine phosphorylase